MTFSNPVIIIGMHRSGTSCLTGCLEEAGLYLGEVNRKAPFNPKGNNENVPIRDLHVKILRRVGAAWDKPPDQAPIWTEAELAELDSLISAYPQDGRWGVKDPRSLFMLDGWQRLTQPAFAGTFRNPNEVAQSLVSRAQKWNQEMSFEQAYDLWLAYNGQMLNLYQQAPFPVIRYDIPAEDYLRRFQQLATQVGLDAPERLTFKEDRLHNHRQTENIPRGLQDMWEALNEISIH